MLLGLATLAWNARATRDPRQRRGIALVFGGSLFGLLPFLGLAVARPAWLHTEPQAFALLGPLALVPLTFAFAIIRFGLLDIRVMVRRSLVYSVVTVGVAAVYAAALALVNNFALGSQLSTSPMFPIFFALGVLLLLEPLRHRVQGKIDAFVHADRRRLEEAIRNLGRAVAAELDPQPVVRDVVERLPQILGLHFAALYLEKDGALERAHLLGAHLERGVHLLVGRQRRRRERGARVAAASSADAKRSAADQALYEKARKECNNVRKYPDGARPIINYKGGWFRCQEPKFRRD